MSEFSDTGIIDSVKDLLIENKILSGVEAAQIFDKHLYKKIAADGSSRHFLRIKPKNFSDCIIIAPAGNSVLELAESRSVWKIGNHMRRHDIPVPELYGWQPETGVIILEDLGDCRLHDAAQSVTDTDKDNVFSHYRDAVKILAKMQIKGREGLQENWCWDTPRYDVSLMLEKESYYFIRAFWQGILGKDLNTGVEDELRNLAARASEPSTEFFLHRDFQSRNIMIKDGAVRIIDFQGGRFGPLGYDIASLLIDPYAGLSREMQKTLLHLYINAVKENITVDKNSMINQFYLFALQRNLQIIGAFSYLSQVKGKRFFRDYIRPALVSLNDLLANHLFLEYSRLRAMVRQGLLEFDSKSHLSRSSG